MEPIIIRGVKGPGVSGTAWVISEGRNDLEQTSTKKQAIKRARSTWAAPGQKIKVVNTAGRVEVIREEDPSKQPTMQGGGGSGGLFGAW